MTHVIAAILLFSLALVSVMISVLIAVKPPAADQASSALVKKANKVGRIENIIVGILILTGLITMLMGSWSLSQLWLWLSLLVMVAYSLVLTFITKPARLSAMKNRSGLKVGMQVCLQVAHVLIVIVVFPLMLLKPI